MFCFTRGDFTLKQFKKLPASHLPLLKVRYHLGGSNVFTGCGGFHLKIEHKS